MPTFTAVRKRTSDISNKEAASGQAKLNTKCRAGTKHRAGNVEPNSEKFPVQVLRACCVVESAQEWSVYWCLVRNCLDKGCISFIAYSTEQNLVVSTCCWHWTYRTEHVKASLEPLLVLLFSFFVWTHQHQHTKNAGFWFLGMLFLEPAVFFLRVSPFLELI